MNKNEKDIQAYMLSTEEVARELGKATSIVDFTKKTVSSHGCSPRRRRDAGSGIDC